MITYRLRGLINLHTAVVALSAALFFLFCAASFRYVARGELSPDVNLTLYVLCVVGGMLASGRYVSQFSTQFHRLSWVSSARIATRQVLLVALANFTIMVATKDRSMSRLMLAGYLVLLWFVLHGVNHFLSRTLAAIAFHTVHRVPTLFLGSTASFQKLSEWIRQKEHLGYHAVGVLTESSEAQPNPSSGLENLGDYGALARVIEARNVAQVILLELPQDRAVTAEVLEKCQDAGARLLICTNLDHLLPVPMLPVMEDDRLFLAVQDEPLEDPMNRMMKRAYDVAVALPVVLLLLPVLALVVWLVQRWQSPGPVFFARPRGGQRRQEFIMLKFRSMRHAPADAQGEAVQARPGDDRIYPFGRFLRKTSLDEFPQFWNVLMGKMSVVGPRPHLPEHDREFTQVARAYRTRQLVKPGITGLAQVQGYRGEIADESVLQRRVQLDIQYITHWSIWLDVQITIKTFGIVFFPPKSAV
jgi:exopolysaccharide biosynthesis polyprenyl glycosylphosphotransferase